MSVSCIYSHKVRGISCNVLVRCIDVHIIISSPDGCGEEGGDDRRSCEKKNS